MIVKSSVQSIEDKTVNHISQTDNKSNSSQPSNFNVPTFLKCIIIINNKLINITVQSLK